MSQNDTNKVSQDDTLATDKTTTTVKPAAKYRYDDYLDMFTMRKRPISVEYIEKFANDMVLWALNDPDAFKLAQYYRIRGVCGEDMERWAERYPNLKTANRYVLGILGDKREMGALKKDYDSGMVRTMMPRYDKDWRNIEKWRSLLREQESKAAGGTKFVVMDKFPDSDQVPAKQAVKEVPAKKKQVEITADTTTSDLGKKK